MQSSSLQTNCPILNQCKFQKLEGVTQNIPKVFGNDVKKIVYKNIIKYNTKILHFLFLQSLKNNPVI